MKLDGLMDGWVDGWMDGKAGLRIAYSNQKLIGYSITLSHLTFCEKMTPQPETQNTCQKIQSV